MREWKNCEGRERKMSPEEIERRTVSMKQYKKDKSTIQNLYPNAYDMDETLEVLRKMYSFLKERHLDLPKLKKRTIEKFPKGEKRSSSAYCDYVKKQIKFKPIILKKRVDVTSILDNNDWKIYHGNYMLFELLTHEMSHFRVKGLHNKRFYRRQIQLFTTAINGLISGEYYR